MVFYKNIATNANIETKNDVPKTAAFPLTVDCISVLTRPIVPEIVPKPTEPDDGEATVSY